jgi:hypothetical protein
MLGFGLVTYCVSFMVGVRKGRVGFQTIKNAQIAEISLCGISDNAPIRSLGGLQNLKIKPA